MSESKTETTPDATEYKGKVNLVSSEGDKFEVDTKTAAMSELVKSTFFIYFFIFFFIRSQILPWFCATLKKQKVFVLVALQVAGTKPRRIRFQKFSTFLCAAFALRCAWSNPSLLFFLIYFLWTENLANF